MARVMLHIKRVPQSFWAEAINTACYTINRVYVRPGISQTPYEIWNGRKPLVKYFRVFGSKCSILREGDSLGKFDSRSDEGIFLGYSNTSRAYRVFNLRTSTLVVSANVRIDDLALRDSSPRFGDDTCLIWWDVFEEITPSVEKEGGTCNEGGDDILGGVENEDEVEVNEPIEDEGVGQHDRVPLISKEPSARVKLHHPISQVIGDPNDGIKTRMRHRNEVNLVCYSSILEPLNEVIANIFAKPLDFIRSEYLRRSIGLTSID